MNEKYLAILELAKKKEGWKQRCEELKFGCFLITPSGISKFIRIQEDLTDTVHYPRYLFLYKGGTSDNQVVDCKILGQLSKSDIVEWLGIKYSMCCNMIFDNYVDDNGILQETLLVDFKPGELFEQPNEVLDQVIELMEKELT